MRQRTIGILAAATFLAAVGFSYKSSEAPGPPFYKIIAHPVAKHNLTALQGTFQMIKTSAASGIPSTKVGGGCLVFDPADIGFPIMAKIKTCTKNSDCAVKGESEKAAYCDGQVHTCWARPAADPIGKNFCNRPITMSPNVLNPAPVTPADGSTLGIKKGARVRVVACLNKTGAKPGQTGTGCASPNGPDRMEVMGPIAKVN